MLQTKSKHDILLYCFPYAGGSSLIYRDWKNHLNENINIIPFELAGRGERINEQLYVSIDEIATDFINKAGLGLYHKPYCLFGHSMGAVIIIKILDVLRRDNLPMPKHVFISGSKPLHLKDESREDYLLADKDFINVIKKQGGTPDEFFHNKDLVEFFLPILRHDFKMASFQLESDMNINPYNVDFSVLYGEFEEDISPDEINEWSKYTSKKIEIHKLSGDHFFINTHSFDVINIVKQQLCLMV